MAGWKPFNYEKAGPGVDKNAPQKKSFFLFFDIFSRKFWQLMLVNLLYILLSLPVLTNGLAQAGITMITRNFVLEKPCFPAADFFATIKKNWKQALPVGIINLLAGALLGFDLFFFYMNWETWFGKLGMVVAFTVSFYFLFMQYYIYLMMITFDLSIKQLYKNSLILAAAGMKRNLLLTVILILLYAVIFGLPLLIFIGLGNMMGFLLALLIYVFFLPGWQALLTQFMVFPVVKKHMIDPYYEEHPEAAEDDRRLLNLQETPEENQDAVFKDMGSREIPPEEEPAVKGKETDRKTRDKNADEDGTI